MSWRPVGVSVRMVRTKIFNISAAIVVAVNGLGAAMPLFLSQKAAALAPSTIVINEVSPVSSSEWVELYNPTDSAVDLSGWRLKDDSGHAFGSVIASGTSIAAHGYFVVSASGVLNNIGGDEAVLLNASSTVVDTVAYGSDFVGGSEGSAIIPTATQSLARTYDGAASWVVGAPTKNANNLGVSATLTEVYVSPSGTGTDCTDIYPCGSFAAAMNRIATGGTMHVADGSYTQDLSVTKSDVSIVGDSENGVVITTDGGASYGVSLQDVSNVSLSNLTLKVGASDSLLAYHLHAYQVKGLHLSDLNFSGSGAGHAVGGVDSNSSSNITIDNVNASYYGKNGFSFTAQYAANDTPMSTVSLSNITADHNSWAGLAFYATNSAGTVGHNISGVTFGGNNTLTNNKQAGLFIEGDSDAHWNDGVSSSAPTYNVSGVGGGILSLGSTAFSGNKFDITNYQLGDVDASAATFKGTIGNDMTRAQRDKEDVRIFDQVDDSDLGLVAYYNVPIQLWPHNDAVINSNTKSTSASWTSVPSAISYEYQTFSDAAGITELSDRTTPFTFSTAPLITSDGVVYWHVRAIFNGNVTGSWSPLWQFTRDNTAPVVHITAPADSQTIGGTVQLTGVISDANLASYRWVIRNSTHQIVVNDLVKQTSISPLAWNTNDGTIPDGTYTITLSATDDAHNKGSDTITVTIDNAAPAAPTLTSPSDGAAENATAFDFTWNAVSDSRGAVSYDFESSHSSATLPDGGFAAPIASAQTGITATNIPNPNTSDGTYYWHVRTVSASGAVSSWSDTWSMSIDTIAPVVAITSPSDDATLSGTVTVSGTVDDATAKPVFVLLDASDNPIYEADGTTSFDWDTTKIANGTYTIGMTAVDPAGNMAQPVFVTVKVVNQSSNKQGSSSTKTSSNSGTNHLSTAISTPQILGASTGPSSNAGSSDQTSGKVLGTSTDKSSTQPTTTSKNASAKTCSKFLGLCWYWWIPIVAVVIAILYYIYRHADTEDKITSGTK